MNEQTFELIKMILELAVYAICIYLIPVIKKAIQSWIDNNMTEEQINVAKQSISFAQQMIREDDNEAKKKAAIEYVASFAKSKNWNITDEQISNLIESLYNQFKINGKKWINN